MKAERERERERKKERRNFMEKITECIFRLSRRETKMNEEIFRKQQNINKKKKRARMKTIALPSHSPGSKFDDDALPLFEVKQKKKRNEIIYI